MGGRRRGDGEGCWGGRDALRLEARADVQSPRALDLKRDIGKKAAVARVAKAS
jgi:hypothetical protein